MRRSHDFDQTNSTLFGAKKLMYAIVFKQNIMMGQLDNFQWLNIHRNPILATFSLISRHPKEISKHRVLKVSNAE